MKSAAFSRHEILDRAHVAQSSFETHVAEHPEAKRNPRLRAACRAASLALAEVYHAAGQLAPRKGRK